VHDLIVVDAPASGHSLPLLAAPQTLGALAHIGPVADTLRTIGARLADPATTLVCLVTTPEELAVRETIEFLATEKHLSREDAYMLASVAVDFCITQLVDGNKGVHAMIPKRIFH
jgi:anion-transporting  ArsA/GET3 family ATPase